MKRQTVLLCVVDAVHNSATKEIEELLLAEKDKKNIIMVV